MIVRGHDPIPDRIRILAIVLGAVVGILFIGGLVYLGIEGATGDITIAVTGAAVGLTFVAITWMFLRAPTQGMRTSLIMLLALFVLCWLLSLVVALALWGELDPAGYLGILLVIGAAVIMAIIVVDAGKMLAPGGAQLEPPRPPPPPPPPQA